MEGVGSGVSRRVRSSGNWREGVGEEEGVTGERFVTTKRIHPAPSLNEVHGGMTGERELPG